jgi:hypothetical protein
MRTSKLHHTDYVLYDEANDSLYRDSKGAIVIFGSLEEAISDCYGNESIIPLDEVPSQFLVELKNQILDL